MDTQQTRRGFLKIAGGLVAASLQLASSLGRRDARKFVHQTLGTPVTPDELARRYGPGVPYDLREYKYLELNPPPPVDEDRRAGYVKSDAHDRSVRGQLNDVLYSEEHITSAEFREIVEIMGRPMKRMVGGEFIVT